MSYKSGGTGKGSGVRTGLDKERFEANMERLRKSSPCKITAKEIVKDGAKTTFKY